MTKVEKSYDTTALLDPIIREMYSFGVVMSQMLTKNISQSEDTTLAFLCRSVCF